MSDPSSNVEVDPLHCLIHYVAELPACDGDALEESRLRAIGHELLRRASDVEWSRTAYPLAREGEKLMHEIYISPHHGASLYLVSESPGSSDCPHEHSTWTVVVGLEGAELNISFAIVEPANKLVRSVSERLVGAGEILTLPPDAIHAVRVAGRQSTFHLHLYGSPISSRKPFSARCFVAIE